MSTGLSSSFDADEWLVTLDPYGYSPIEFNDGPVDYFNITHDPDYDYLDSQSPQLMHTPQCDRELPEQVVSRAFHPDALINGFAPDKLVISSDDTRFFVHSFIVSVTPSLQEDPTKVGDDAVVLNIILHTLYNMSCAPYQPSFHSLGKALGRLASYGMDPAKYIVPANPTFDVLTSHAPYLPLDLYTLAAHFNLYELASVASSHLLSLKLSSLSDDTCSQIGSRYLVRLFNLHIHRMSALKDIIITPPNRHQATSSCKAKEQDVMVGEWAMVVAYLSRDASPAMSSSLLVSQFRPVTASITCALCRRNVHTRLDLLSTQWSAVKVRVRLSVREFGEHILRSFKCTI